MDEFRSVSKRDQLHLHRKILKKMINISNHKRDLDVMIKHFSSYDKTGVDTALQRLMGSLKKMQNETDRKLLLYLQSPDYVRELKSWTVYLEKVYKNDIASEGSIPIEKLSKEVIYARFSVIKREIISLNSKKHKKMKELHTLRISYKKLRYLLETFSSLYSKKEVESLLKQMKKIQNLLGSLHDNYQQKKTFQLLLENEKDEAITIYIKHMLEKDLKRSRKKEKLKVDHELKRFLQKETLYKTLFR